MQSERIDRVLVVAMTLGVSLLALAPPSPGEGAQEVTTIRGEPVCGSCVVEATEVTVVSSPPDVGLTPLDSIALAADGTVWVAPYALQHAVLRYQPDGIQDLRIAERGQGPREFERIQRVATGPGGVLHVFGDQKHNRYSPSGEFLGTRRIPGLFRQVLDLAILPDGTLVLNENPLGGHVFHVVDPATDAVNPPGGLVGSDPSPMVRAGDAVDGGSQIARSFGPRTDGYEFASDETRRRLAARDKSTFWAAPVNRYELELWDTTGSLHRRIVREAEWFEPWAGDWEPPFEEPAPPRLAAIMLDEAGRLWVLLYLPARNFSPTPRPAAQDFLAPSDASHPAYDTLVEILDLEAGQIVARAFFRNKRIEGFLRGRHVVFRDVSDSGLDQVFRIHALTLAAGAS